MVRPPRSAVTVCIALLTTVLAAGCSGRPPSHAAASGESPGLSAALRARKPGRVLPVAKIWPATGICVQLQDGRLFVVHGAYDWPTVLTVSDRPNTGISRLVEFNDPLQDDLLTSLQQLPDGPDTSRVTANEAIRFLALAPIVSDPDWRDLAVTSVERTSPRSFSLVLTKHGIPLAASASRITSHDYRPDYGHGSIGYIEDYSLEATRFADLLDHARRDPDASASRLREAIALLRKPVASTDGPDEP